MLGGIDFHFISENVKEEDIELFFGPLDGDELFITIQPRWNMANLMHEAGIFKSATQARKNGEDKPIPKGFSHITRGKKARKKQIYILNIIENETM